MRIMQDNPPMSLEDISRTTGYPKSSLTRIMETLVELNTVSRNPVSKKYSCSVAMLPLNKNHNLQQILDNELARLAKNTGHSSEWYIPGDAGLMLVRQVESPESIVHVRAKIGFIRFWNEELDSVAALGLAWLKEKVSSFSGFNFFKNNGVRAKLSAAEAKAKVALAREQKCLADEILNDNGVRRSAAIVFENDMPVGVVAVAEYFVPGGVDKSGEIMEAVMETASRLSNRDISALT
ncbi:MAG: helix-turn-helix domain-containing protein [Planctomycetes bacterium]|nr:helix-turn-helix domain-containing protein [Planctomycetota bacterium]